jgi:iron uptake system component EfeO
LTPVADHLVADATDLQEKLRGPKLTPADLVHGASRLSQQLASGRIASGEDAYSKTDLDDVAANLESIGKILELTGPVVQKSAPEVTEAAQKALTQAQGALERLKDGDGYRPFDAVDAWTRAELAKTFTVLADALAKLEPTMDVRS